MKITFVLPVFSRFRVGGFKVIYEYANHLQMRGHKVTVVHVRSELQDPLQVRLRRRIMPYYVRLRYGRIVVPWFDVHPEVRLLIAPNERERWIPDADTVVATSWRTAEWVRSYNKAKGEKFYLIHDYEYFMTEDSATKNRMAGTFTAGLHNIVTSPAGVEMMGMCGAVVCAYIPNGINLNTFRQTNGIDSATRVSIGFPSRPEFFKGTADAVSAITKVRTEYAINLPVWSFGRPYAQGLPDWIKYYADVSDEMLRELYNTTSVFVVPSHYEGWGLPGAEAMACGAALASTDNGGVRAYAEDKKTALFSSPNDPTALARNILKFLRTPDFRVRVAAQGQRTIQQFTWERAADALEHVLKIKG